MSFKRFEPEDIVLSSELITFPTWYTQKGGDTSDLDMTSVVTSSNQGPSSEYYIDYYSGYSNSDSGSVEWNKEHSKGLFSLAYAQRPDTEDGKVSGSIVTSANIVFGQYRSLVLGDEDSEFRFGFTTIGYTESSSAALAKTASFVAMTVDRSRFREKLDPQTCRINFNEGLVLAPDITVNERYLDAGRVYDLAKFEEDESGSHYRYPSGSEGSSATSYGYFLPDIGVVLFNTEDLARQDYGIESWDELTDHAKVEAFKDSIKNIVLRSQETVTSNYVFVRVRNAEFNYSTNPSNVTGSAGNIRWDVMINQPQTFITTVGLYNDANELLAVAKLSRPLIKDFSKEALIRVKLDY